MSLDIIIGPMFSGKTTELLRRLYTLSYVGKKCLYLNHCLDKRETSDMSTHNPIIKKLDNKINSIKINSITDNIHILQEYDVIGIDEGQLFTNLKEPINKLINEFDKHVIISGLNSDYKQDKFGEIIDLITICDKIDKLSPYCVDCAKDGLVVDAIFTKRLTDETEVVSIGYDEYKPVCRKCYKIIIKYKIENIKL